MKLEIGETVSNRINKILFPLLSCVSISLQLSTSLIQSMGYNRDYMYFYADFYKLNKNNLLFERWFRGHCNLKSLTKAQMLTNSVGSCDIRGTQQDVSELRALKLKALRALRLRSVNKTIIMSFEKHWRRL